MTAVIDFGKKLLSLLVFLIMLLVFVIVANKYYGLFDLSGISNNSYLALKNAYRKRVYAKELSLLMQNSYESSTNTGNSVVEIEQSGEDITKIISTVATSVPVINYHGVADEPYKEDILTQNFKDHMFTLKRAGYNTITIEDFYDFVTGKKDLPPKSILITFDDGIRTSYNNADPILEITDYNAVMFVISKQSAYEGSHYYLSNSELLKMTETGRWELQAHAKDSHENILINAKGDTGSFLGHKMYLPTDKRLETDDEYRARVRKEFEDSYKVFEDIFGYKPLAFSFPFGEYGQDSKNFDGADEIVLDELDNVYTGVNFFQVWSSRGATHNYVGVPEHHMYRRISVDSSWSGEELLNIIENGYTKELRYKDSLLKDKGWRYLWGTVEYNEDDNSVQLFSIDGSKSNGAGTFLDGTYLWDDYEVVADLSSFKGQTLSLMFNYVDNDNFDVCEFSPGRYSRIERQVDGERILLAEGDFDYSLEALETFEVGFRNSDDEIVCFFDGERVLEYNFDSSTPVKVFGIEDEGILDADLITWFETTNTSGGIGFIIWDPVGPSTLKIREVSSKKLVIKDENDSATESAENIE